MTPLDWLEFGRTFGLPVLLLTAVGIFFYKSIWPFLESQIKDAQERAEKDRDEFIAALKRRDDEFGKVVDGLNKMGDSIERLRQDITEQRTRRPPQK